ncbi:MAG: RNA polymerase subunit sigma-70, partial [Lachnospiraceae bacterium]|nr:RNA polymerase subunit sigma-70 [Lachnospiraceae bacterium]
IMQITANEAKMIYRKMLRTRCVESIEEKAPAFIDNYHELWDAVMKLDLVFREVIILYFYESLSVKEIGRVLHIAEGTVKSRLFRGKKYLKDMLED